MIHALSGFSAALEDCRIASLPDFATELWRGAAFRTLSGDGYSSTRPITTEIIAVAGVGCLRRPSHGVCDEKSRFSGRRNPTSRKPGLEQRDKPDANATQTLNS